MGQVKQDLRGKASHVLGELIAILSSCSESLGVLFQYVNVNEIFGGPTDLWGYNNWTPSTVRDQTFGAEFYVLCVHELLVGES